MRSITRREYYYYYISTEKELLNGRTQILES